MAEFENLLPEFIFKDCFLADKVQINNFSDFNFHCLVVLFNNLILSRLETVYERIKRYKKIEWEMSRVQSWISFCIYDKSLILDYKLKDGDFVLLVGDVVGFFKH